MKAVFVFAVCMIVVVVGLVLVFPVLAIPVGGGMIGTAIYAVVAHLVGMYMDRRG